MGPVVPCLHGSPSLTETVWPGLPTPAGLHLLGTMATVLAAATKRGSAAAAVAASARALRPEAARAVAVATAASGDAFQSRQERERKGDAGSRHLIGTSGSQWMVREGKNELPPPNTPS